MYNKPIVSKGTKFYWENELICVARVDCWPGDIMSIDQFEWYKDKPSFGDPIHPSINEYLFKHIQHVKNSKFKIENVS